MATHCSLLAWDIPWTEEPGGLQSMGSQRVRYDSVTDTHTKSYASFKAHGLSPTQPPRASLSPQPCLAATAIPSVTVTTLLPVSDPVGMDGVWRKEQVLIECRNKQMQ